MFFTFLIFSCNCFEPACTTTFNGDLWNTVSNFQCNGDGLITINSQTIPRNSWTNIGNWNRHVTGTLKIQGIGKVVVDGGFKITGWTPDTQNPNILKTTVSKTISTTGHEDQVSDWKFEYLWVNDRDATRARVPGNWTLPTIKSISTSGSGDYLTYTVGVPSNTMKFLTPLTNDELKKVNIVIFHYWSTTRAYISSIDSNANTITFQAHSFNPSNNKGIEAGKSYFYLDNLKTALTKPGEWFLSNEGELFYYPLPGETASNIEVYASHFKRLMYIETDNLIIENIEFRHCGGNIPETGVTREDLVPQSATLNMKAIDVYQSSNIQFIKCSFRHMFCRALSIFECTNCVVEECLFEDFGADGIAFGDSSGSRIYNNILRHGGRIIHHENAIYDNLDPGALISHNDISDNFWDGINCWVKDSECQMTIEKNHVHHIGYNLLDDIGCIYVTNARKGVVIQNNHVHDAGCHNYGAWGLYVDLDCHDVVVQNNLAHDFFDGCVHFHYGFNNVVKNNILGFNEKGLMSKGENNAGTMVTISSNIFITNIGNFYCDLWGSGTFSSYNNLYWDFGLGIQWFRDNDGIDNTGKLGDPKFKDPLNRDFTFTDQSMASSIGFVPFTYTDCGVVGDDWRKVASDYVVPAFPVKSTDDEALLSSEKVYPDFEHVETPSRSISPTASSIITKPPTEIITPTSKPKTMTQTPTTPPVTPKTPTSPPVIPQTPTSPPVIPQTPTSPPVTPKTPTSPPVTPKTPTSPPVTPKTPTSPPVTPKTPTSPPVTPQTPTSPPVTPKTPTSPPVTPKTPTSPPVIPQTPTTPPVPPESPTIPPVPPKPEYSNIEITGPTSTIYLKESSIVDNSHFIDCSLTDGGEYLFVVQNEAHFSNSDFSFLNSQIGAIKIEFHGKVTIENCLFTGCSVKNGNGNAILVSQPTTSINENSMCSIVVNGSSFRNCGTNGYSFYLSNANINNLESTLELDNTTFESQSGGLYLKENNRNVKIANCSFVNHTTTQNGAAIQVSLVSSLSIEDTLFENNVCDNQGGAIFIAGGSSSAAASSAYCRISSCTFRQNKAELGGNAIFVGDTRTDESLYVIENNVFESNYYLPSNVGYVIVSKVIDIDVSTNQFSNPNSQIRVNPFMNLLKPPFKTPEPMATETINPDKNGVLDATSLTKNNTQFLAVISSDKVKLVGEGNENLYLQVKKESVEIEQTNATFGILLDSSSSSSPIQSVKLNQEEAHMNIKGGGNLNIDTSEDVKSLTIGDVIVSHNEDLRLSIMQNLNSFELGSLSLYGESSFGATLKNTESTTTVNSINVFEGADAKISNIEIANDFNIETGSTIELKDVTLKSADISIAFKGSNQLYSTFTGKINDRPNSLSLKKDASSNSNEAAASLLEDSLFYIISTSKENFTNCNEWKDKVKLDGTDFRSVDCKVENDNQVLYASTEEPSKSKKSLYILIAIVVAAVIVVVIIIVVIVVVVKKKKNKSSDVQMETNNNEDYEVDSI